jgi:hypothetical protein
LSAPLTGFVEAADARQQAVGGRIQVGGHASDLFTEGFRSVHVRA